MVSNTEMCTLEYSLMKHVVEHVIYNYFIAGLPSYNSTKTR